MAVGQRGMNGEYVTVAIERRCQRSASLTLQQIGDQWQFEVPRPLTNVFSLSPILHKERSDFIRPTEKRLYACGIKAGSQASHNKDTRRISKAGNVQIRVLADGSSECATSMRFKRQCSRGRRLYVLND